MSELVAKHRGKEREVVSHTLQLVLLSPEIIHLSIIGALPDHVTLKSLKAGLPGRLGSSEKVFED